MRRKVIGCAAVALFLVLFHGGCASTNTDYILIFADSSGHMGQSHDGPRLIFWLESSGQLTWSTDKVRGGPPYYRADFPDEKSATVFNCLAGSLKSVHAEKQSYFGPDAPIVVIHCSAGGTTRTLSSWHEPFEENPSLVALDRGITVADSRSRKEMLARQPPSYIAFRAAYSSIRHCVDSLIMITEGSVTEMIPPKAQSTIDAMKIALNE